MKYTFGQAALLVALYIALAAAPLLIAYSGPLPAARSFLIEFSVGLGFVGLSIMGLQFVLTGRFHKVAASLGLDSMLQFHRQAGLIAFFFILAHPILAFLDDPAYLAFLDPTENLPRAFALSAVIGALTLLLITTLWRQVFKLQYEWWRALHGLLAVFILFVGLVHVLQVGHYVSALWKQALWMMMTVGAICLLAKTRIIRPIRARREPYRVVENREERGATRTLVLEPVRHEGLSFLPGQFIWLTLGDTPFSLQQHPFSISSSSQNRERIELTIKELGDFTATIKDVKPGTTAFIEGPFGAFTPDTDSEKGAVFIVGGVGITPVMSILRTFRDKGDTRRMNLIYASRNLEDTLFFEEISSLEEELNISAVFVIQDPPPDWIGESGWINREMLDRNLPHDLSGFDCFVCGPEPMMDIVEPYLKDRRVPIRQIFSERFNIV